MSTDALIHNVSVGSGEPTDIAVTNGVISHIGNGLERSQVAADATVVDAEGLVALPAFVDLHTHLREPGREDAETIASGSRAAAAGGFSAICAMANTNPVTDTAQVAEFVHDTGREAGLVHVQPVGAVSKGLQGKELAELGLMNASRARVTMFSDDGLCVADSQLMRRALDYIRSFDGVISQHAQDPRLAGTASCCHEGEVSGKLGLAGWPGVAEEVIVARDVQLAKYTGARVHVAHLTSAESVEIVRWAKTRGVRVTCEVTPHHLLLPTDLLESYDPVFKVNPPLRPQEEIEALRAGVVDGTIDAIATDHAPHAPQDKDHCFAGAAFGMLGLETSFSIMNTLFVQTGLMTFADLTRVMSSNPATIAGLTQHGRPLAVGEPANIALVDPHHEWVVDREDSFSLSRNNPYHGRSLTGRVVSTLWEGKLTHTSDTDSQEH